MNSEIGTAKNWYYWLWFSPAFTVTTSLILAFIFYATSDIFFSSQNDSPPSDGFLLWSTILIQVIIPGLLHLILLMPALLGRTVFIRWHGRQALLLAAIRTLIMLFVVICQFLSSFFNIIAIVLLITLLIVWFFGTLFSQIQANRGDSLLMRWAGLDDALPKNRLVTTIKDLPAQLPVQEVVRKIRNETDPTTRSELLTQLLAQGIVESLQ